MKINYLFIWTLVLIISCSNNSKINNKSISPDFLNYVSSDSAFKKVKQINNLKYNIENTKIDQTVELINTEIANDTINISQLNDDAIFMYATYTHCDACILQELNTAKKYYDINQLIVLFKAMSYRDVKVFKKVNKLGYKFYFMSQNSLLSDAVEKTPVPLFFTKDSNSIIHNVFPVIGFYPELTEDYHEIMLSKLNKSLYTR